MAAFESLNQRDGVESKGCRGLGDAGQLEPGGLTLTLLPKEKWHQRMFWTRRCKMPGAAKQGAVPVMLTIVTSWEPHSWYMLSNQKTQ